MAASRGRLALRALGDLLGPPFPPGTEDAWTHFLALHSTRPIGAHGPTGIPYSELVAYQHVTETALTPLEVACIRAADEAYLARAYERMAAGRDAAPPAEDAA